jgi:hypothetical protein
VSQLVYEILLRLLKALAGLILGLIVYAVAVGLLGHPGSVELALLSWLSGASFILLVQESPI